jgi:hypothetical protein
LIDRQDGDLGTLAEGGKGVGEDEVTHRLTPRNDEHDSLGPAQFNLPFLFPLPVEAATQHLIQLKIVRFEVCGKLGAKPLRHGIIAAAVQYLAGSDPVSRDAKEIARLIQALLGLLEEALALQDQEALGWVPGEPGSQLLRVTPPCQVGVMLMAHAVVAVILTDSGGFSCQTLLLAPDRLCKRQLLSLHFYVVVVLREGPINRIPEQDDELDAGQQPMASLSCLGVVEIVWAGLTDQATEEAVQGKMGAIPERSSGVVDIKEVYLLLRW